MTLAVPFLDVGAQNKLIANDLRAAYERVMSRGNYILGDEVAAFEREFAAYCGRAYCVGVGNGLDALRLILMGYGIGPGDEVIVPTNTYIATWLAVTATGATIVPVEPNPDTFCIDPHGVFEAMTDRTRAVLAVHLYGRQCEMLALSEITQGKCRLIVDAAQGHGLKELGDAAGFSFYPTKNLGAIGDGGAVVTDDGDLAEHVATLRNYGSPVKNYFSHGDGINSRLDELQAAFLRAKLPMLDDFNDMRRLAADVYDAARGIPQEKAPHVRHLYVMRCLDRPALQATLTARGVGWAVHYPCPPHLQRAYRDLGYVPGHFPIAERLARECISLPCGPELTGKQIDAVAKCVELDSVYI